MWPNPRIPYQMSSDRPRLEPLNGKPLMVNPVVAIEYWPFDRPMPRGILPAPHGRPSEPPDVANYSWVNTECVVVCRGSSMCSADAASRLRRG